MGRRGVIIVGTGLIARFHAKAVNASEKLELKGFVGRSHDKAARLCDEFGGVPFVGLDEAFRSDGEGMAVVATASGAHDEAVFAAAMHRVPVLVEKPIAISVERTDRMIAACRETGTPLGCIFQTRWTDEFRDAKAKVDSGALGRLTYGGIRVPWWRSDEYYSGSSWHGSWDMDGGGALMNQSIHMVDWLVSLMPPVEDVRAFAATLAHPMEAEDTVSAAILFRGGALGGVYATTASYPGRGKSMELTGTGGTIEISDGGHGVSRPDALDYAPHMACFEAFADSLEPGGAPYPIPGEEARKSVDLIERIYRSAGLAARSAT